MPRCPGLFPPVCCAMLALMLLIGDAGAVWGQDREEPNGRWDEIGQPPDAEAHPFVAGTKVQFQSGVMFRFAADRFDESVEPVLFTVGVNVPFYWDREHTTWGLGAQAVFDVETGPRFGPKLIWRRPLKARQPNYFQLGAGVYLWSMNDDFTVRTKTGVEFGRMEMPGFFGEAEIGLGDSFAVSAAVEAVPVVYASADLFREPGLVFDQRRTDLNFYVGLEASGKAGTTVLVGGLLVGGLMVGSMMAGMN